VQQSSSYLAELVRINDTLIWSWDRMDSFVAAVRIIRDTVGATLAPSFLVDATGTRLELVGGARERAALEPDFSSMPAYTHLREPWINDGEWPVCAADHLDSEAWRILPDDFKAWFGEVGIVVAIHADGRHLGAVLLTFDPPRRLTEEELEFCAVAGRILGSALYRWQVLGREREMGALEERRRLSEELHDDLSQQVASLGLLVETMKLDAAGIDGDIAEDIRQLDRRVTALRKHLRHQMLGLRADAEMVEGALVDQVAERIAHFEQQWQTPVSFSCTCPAEVDDEAPLAVSAQLLRVLQESLANIVLHARATRVQIRLGYAQTLVRLEIQDDGVGFDLESVPDSRLGVLIMRQRMEQIGGSLTISPVPDGGMLIVAEAPIGQRRRVTLEVPGHA